MNNQPNPKPKRSSLRPKSSLRIKRRIIVTACSVFFLVAGALTVYFNTGLSLQSKAADSLGDYRSAGTGNWGTLATWQMYNGSSWGGAILLPTSTSGVITIRNGHTVTVAASTSGDQLIIESGGILNVNTGTLTIANGAGTDLVNNGTSNVNTGGTLTIAAGASVEVSTTGTHNYNGGTQSLTGWTVKNGGTYVHNVNNINLPTATWGASSTLKVTGVTTSDLKGMNQNFGNFIYDCPGQTGSIEFWESISSIQGNFTVVSTGSGATWVQRLSTATPLSVTGYYLQTGGTIYGTKGAVFTWNIGSTFTLDGGTFIEVERYGMPVMNIYGQFTINGGTFNHSTYSSNLASEGIGTVNLFNNYLRTAGLHTETAALTGRGDFNFAKSGLQTFVHTGGTITNTVNFTVNSGSILDISTYTVTGGGSFNLNSGAGLILASPNGITATGASGNVQVTGTRTFSTDGDYTYNAASAQVTGSGLPTTVHNITFDNSNDVSLSASTSATNLITMSNGRVITGSSELGTTNTNVAGIVNYNQSRYVVGNLRREIAASGSYDFPVGTLNYYELASLSFTGKAGFSNILSSFVNELPVSPSYPIDGLTINGTPIIDMLNYGYWILTPNSAMTAGNYNVTLNERGHTNSSSDPHEYGVLKRENTGSYWKSLGVHSNDTQSEMNGTATATRSQLDAFSHFGIGKGNGPLPVTLINFDAKPVNKTVQCNWKTAAEINNHYFTIERSVDGKTFSEVDRIAGAGTSSNVHSYIYFDKNPLSGISYYRLKQTDFDGKSELFNIIRVNMNTRQTAAGEITIRPNPVDENFNLSFDSDEEGAAVITITTLNGIRVLSEQIQYKEGQNDFSLTLPSGTRSGTYLLKVAGDKLALKPVKIIKK